MADAFSGKKWKFRASHPEQDGNLRRSTHLQSHQQVHQRLSEPNRLVRCRLLQGNESSALHYHHFSLLVCGHVWRLRSRFDNVSVRSVDGAEGEAVGC